MFDDIKEIEKLKGYFEKVVSIFDEMISLEKQKENEEDKGKIKEIEKREEDLIDMFAVQMLKIAKYTKD